MGAFELRVFDKEGESNHPMSLIHLMCAVDHEKRDAFRGRWYVRRGAWGYGNIVGAIEDSLRDRNEMPVNLMSLFYLMNQGKEVLNEAHFRKEYKNLLKRLEVGANRTERYLYVVSEDWELLSKIAAHFTDTKIERIAGLHED